MGAATRSPRKVVKVTDPSYSPPRFYRLRHRWSLIDWGLFRAALVGHLTALLTVLLILIVLEMCTG